MRTVRSSVVTGALAAVLGATGCGSETSSSSSSTTEAVAVDQTVKVSMVELAFKPDVITVKAGTTVRFVFTNDGHAAHEAAFGDEAVQQAVESGKQKRDGVEASPGRTASYVRTFTAPGTLLIGCHLPGHYQGGMKARLIVQ